jgi:hypothetical protein
MPVCKKPILKKYNLNYTQNDCELFYNHDAASGAAKIKPATNNDAIEE